MNNQFLQFRTNLIVDHLKKGGFINISNPELINIDFIEQNYDYLEIDNIDQDITIIDNTNMASCVYNNIDILIVGQEIKNKKFYYSFNDISNDTANMFNIDSNKFKIKKLENELNLLKQTINKIQLRNDFIDINNFKRRLFKDIILTNNPILLDMASIKIKLDVKFNKNKVLINNIKFSWFKFEQYFLLQKWEHHHESTERYISSSKYNNNEHFILYCDDKKKEKIHFISFVDLTNKSFWSKINSLLSNKTHKNIYLNSYCYIKYIKNNIIYLHAFGKDYTLGC